MIEIHEGERYGRYTVISPIFKVKNVRTVKCRCDCGKEKNVAVAPLWRGITISCGCYGKEARRLAMTDKAKKERSGKNSYLINKNGNVEMKCSNNANIFVFDRDDLSFALAHTWRQSTTGYIVASDDRSLRFHRAIMKAKKDEIVDHVNRNKLDNRKSNLRVCKQRDNCYNKPPNSTKQASKYKGVFRAKNQKNYFSTIGYKGRQIYLGSYENEIDAAKAYDTKAKELFGDYAYLNFPDENKE